MSIEYIFDHWDVIKEMCVIGILIILLIAAIVCIGIGLKIEYDKAKDNPYDEYGENYR